MPAPQDENIREERRKEPRAYIIFVDYFSGEAPSLKIPTFAKNISSNGICILLVEDVKINTTLFLTIHLLDGEKPVEVKGTVRWTKPSSFLSSKDKNHFEAGLEYMDINNADQARILASAMRTLNTKIDP